MKKLVVTLSILSAVFFATTAMGAVKVYDDYKQLKAYEDAGKMHLISIDEELEDVITVSDDRAVEGSLVKVNVNDAYMVSKIYVNGKVISNNRFLMSNEDVVITADVLKVKKGTYVISKIAEIEGDYVDSNLLDDHMYIEIVDEDTLNVVGESYDFPNATYSINNNILTIGEEIGYSYDATIVNANKIAVDIEAEDLRVEFSYVEDKDVSDKTFSINEFVIDGATHTNILVSITNSKIIFNYYDSGTHHNELKVWNYEVKGTICVVTVSATETLFFSTVDLNDNNPEVDITIKTNGLYDTDTILITATF